MEIFSMKNTIMSTDEEPVILMRHINNSDTISVKQRHHRYWREQQRPSVRRHFFFLTNVAFKGDLDKICWYEKWWEKMIHTRATGIISAFLQYVSSCVQITCICADFHVKRRRGSGRRYRWARWRPSSKVVFPNFEHKPLDFLTRRHFQLCLWHHRGRYAVRICCKF